MICLLSWVIISMATPESPAQGSTPVEIRQLRILPEMQNEVITLWPEGKIPGAIAGGCDETGDIEGISCVHVPTLEYFPSDNKKVGKTAVIVCPGGGYAGLSYCKEGQEIAQWFNGFGVDAFVLKYRHLPYHHPIPLLDAQEAIRLVRSRAKAWEIAPDRIGIMGFSAGGHLAATAVTLYKEPVQWKGVDTALSCRPDFAILGYPVVCMTQSTSAHSGSRTNLLGDNPDPKLCEKLSAELQVTTDTPPIFMFHGRGDAVVPLKNSLDLKASLEKAGVRTGLHISETDEHGYGLRTDTSWLVPCQKWVEGLW